MVEMGSMIVMATVCEEEPIGYGYSLPTGEPVGAIEFPRWWDENLESLV